MSWTGQLYSKAFHDIGDFHLRENDYAFGDRKFGGNAQSITKSRWIHHTSFLWDYDVRNMSYLKHPTKAPEYRLARHHTEFLCPMKDCLPSRTSFIDRTITSVATHFYLKRVLLHDVISNPSSETPFHHTSTLLSKQELEFVLASQISSSIP
ncbi:Lipoate protein ligase-like protein [Zostera marina]|uniref:Lipoate protein ligase-like protein n=1 Tax=Zostera marina TaxID=29655 RepID=A0A0K9PAL1_ZOSMR|nr:Lipoate protein ligase-like protein [Zostera marina]